MNIFFWKKLKAEKPKPRILEFPEDKRVDLLRLCDELNDNEDNKNVRAYRMWEYIHKTFPETRTGSWTLDRNQPANPVVIEKLS